MTVGTGKKRKRRSSKAKARASASSSVPESHGTGDANDQIVDLEEATEESPTKAGPPSQGEHPAHGDHAHPSHEDHQQQVASESVQEKPDAAVDVLVHRMRSLSYHPHPVVALRASPAAPQQPTAWVALSRAQGSVELKRPDQKMRTVATVPGWRDQPVRALAWLCGHDHPHHHPHIDASTSTATAKIDPMLEEEGDDTETDENEHLDDDPAKTARPLLVGAVSQSLCWVDFESGQLRAITASGGGTVLSLTSLCTRTPCAHSCGHLVAAGCEDGAVRLFQVEQQQPLSPTDPSQCRMDLVLTIPTAGAPVLSVAWRRHEPTPSEATASASPSRSAAASAPAWARTVLFAALADGTIRRYDCPRHHHHNSHDKNSLRWAFQSTLRMTVECYGRSIPTKVWALEALTDGTVVSADSLGHVQLWDGESGTLQCSFDQNDNKADVLALDVTAKEDKIFASGVDSRVVCMERSQPTADESFTTDPTASGRWIMTHAQRPHTHDVKAVTIYRVGSDMSSGKMSEVLCTGGVDTKLCTYTVKHFQKKRPRTIYPWPALTPIAVARSARILTMQREDRVDLYEVAARPQHAVNSPLIVREEKTLIGTVEIKSSSNLVCSTLSQDGRYLAIGDATTLFVFKVTCSGSPNIMPRTVDFEQVPCHLPGDVSPHALHFINNGQLVVAASKQKMFLVTLEDAKTSDVAAAVQAMPVVSTDKAFLPTHVIRSSPCGKWLLTLRPNWQDMILEIYKWSDGDKMFKNWWVVPPLESPLSAVSFMPGEEMLVVVACLNFAVYLLDVKRRGLGSWTAQLDFPIGSLLPSEISHRIDYPVQLGIDPASTKKVMMGSFGALIAVDTALAFPKACRVFPEQHVRVKGNKPRVRTFSLTEGEEVAPKETSCTLCLRYNSILYMDFIDRSEMIVVEQPWLNVVATFPDALQRKVYGT